jgi:hypothetical protein
MSQSGRFKGGVFLLGGLGNQLFGWIFAEYLRTTFGREVPLITNFRGSSETNHGSNLEDFPKLLTHHQLISSKTRAARARLGLRFSDSAKNHSWRISRYFHVTKFVELGNPLGYDFKQDGLNHLYVGYLQSYFFFQNSGLQLDALRQLFDIQESCVNTEAVAIHVRGGDYFSNLDSLGVLGVDYYVDALKLQSQAAPLSEVAVFGPADKHTEQTISSLAKKFGDLKFSFKSGFDSRNGSVDLRALARYRRQILSNSSFAWWAACLSESGVKVAPDQWFRRLGNPEGILAGDWVTVKSSWMTSAYVDQ